MPVKNLLWCGHPTECLVMLPLPDELDDDDDDDLPRYRCGWCAVERDLSAARNEIRTLKRELGRLRHEKSCKGE